MIFGEDFYNEKRLTSFQIEKLSNDLQVEKKEREKLQKTIHEITEILKQQQSQLELQQKIIDRLLKNDKKLDEEFGLTPRRNITQLDLEGLKKNQIEIKLYPKSPHSLVSPRKKDSSEMKRIPKSPTTPTKEEEESNLTKALLMDKKKSSKEEEIPKIELKKEDLIERRKSEPIPKFALNAEKIRERRKSEGETPKKRTIVLGQTPIQVSKGSFSINAIKNRAFSEPNLTSSSDNFSGLSTSRTKSELILSSNQTFILNLNPQDSSSSVNTTSLSNSPDSTCLSHDELSISFSPEERNLQKLMKKNSN